MVVTVQIQKEAYGGVYRYVSRLVVASNTIGKRQRCGIALVMLASM